MAVLRRQEVGLRRLHGRARLRGGGARACRLGQLIPPPHGAVRVRVFGSGGWRLAPFESWARGRRRRREEGAAGLSDLELRPLLR